MTRIHKTKLHKKKAKPHHKEEDHKNKGNPNLKPKTIPTAAEADQENTLEEESIEDPVQEVSALEAARTGLGEVLGIQGVVPGGKVDEGVGVFHFIYYKNYIMNHIIYLCIVFIYILCIYTPFF